MTLASWAGGQIHGQGCCVLAGAQHFRPQDLLGDFGMGAAQFKDESAAVEEQRQDAEELGMCGAAIEELLARAIALGEPRDPAQGWHRLGEFRQNLIEGTDQMLKPDDEFAVHLVSAVTAHEEAQLVRGTVGRAQPAPHLPLDFRRRAAGGEEFPPGLKRAVAGLTEEQSLVDAAHPCAQGLKLVLKRRGRREPEVAGNRGNLGGVVRQGVGLVLLAHLDCMLDPAQEPIGLTQELRFPRLHQSVAHELVEGGGGRMRLEEGVAPGVQELEGLHDELDFPDPAVTRLYVAGQGLGADNLLFRAGLHRGHLGQQRRRRMARIAKRLQVLQELRPEREIAGDRPGLDQRHAFPGLAGGGVVVLKAGKRTNQRTEGALRSQADVDAKEETVGGLGLQQAGGGFGDLGEEFDVGEGAGQAVLPAMTLAFVEIDQVDVG